VIEVLPRRELSRAVLIGTSDFQQSLPDLPAVSNNLVDLRTALTDEEVGILGWEQCVVVDSPDSPSSLITRLRSAAAAAQDLLLVYYAGHGIRADFRDELYLTVRQSRSDSPVDTCVPFEWVREVVRDSPARTKLLILDCCYSGMALGTMSSSGVDIRQIEVSGTTVMTSTPKNMPALAPPGDRHTAFTGELITLLRNGSLLADEPLTVAELFRSLRAAMSRRDLPEPKMRSDDTSSSLQLRKFQPPPPPEPEPVVVVPEPITPEPVVPEPVLPEPVVPEPVVTVPAPAVVWSAPEPAHRVEDPDTIRFAPVKPPLNLAPIGGVLRVYLPLVGAIVLLFFADSMLGLFIGAAFGTPPPGASGLSDLGMAIAMAVLALIVGGLALLWHAKGGRWVVLEDAARPWRSGRRRSG
jgi:hypothetical protein